MYAPIKEECLTPEKVVLRTGRHLLGQGTWQYEGRTEELAGLARSAVDAGRGPLGTLQLRTINTYPALVLHRRAHTPTHESFDQAASKLGESGLEMVLHIAVFKITQVIHECLLYKSVSLKHVKARPE